MGSIRHGEHVASKMSHGPLPNCFQCSDPLDMKDPGNHGLCEACTYKILSGEMEDQGSTDLPLCIVCRQPMQVSSARFWYGEHAGHHQCREVFQEIRKVVLEREAKK